MEQTKDTLNCITVDFFFKVFKLDPLENWVHLDTKLTGFWYAKL